MLFRHRFLTKKLFNCYIKNFHNPKNDRLMPIYVGMSTSQLGADYQKYESEPDDQNRNLNLNSNLNSNPNPTKFENPNPKPNPTAETRLRIRNNYSFHRTSKYNITLKSNVYILNTILNIYYSGSGSIQTKFISESESVEFLFFIFVSETIFI